MSINLTCHSQHSSDLIAAHVLLKAFYDHSQGKLSREDFFALAQRRTLAEKATQVSCDHLSRALSTSAELGPASLVLAVAIMMHVSQVNALGHCQWVLGVLDGIIPVCERYAPPELLAAAVDDQAVVLFSAGHLDDALFACDHSLKIYAELVQVQGRSDLANDFARVKVNKGNILKELGRLEEAVQVYQQALDIREDLVERQRRCDLARDLAVLLSNYSIALRALGRFDDALVASSRASDIYNEQFSRQGSPELAIGLANALTNMGNVLNEVGRLEEALRAYERAIIIREDQMEHQGRHEVANYLATALMNKANVLKDLGRPEDAVRACDRAIAIREELVERQGRHELANDLAMALMNKGNALQASGKPNDAIAAYDRAISIRKLLVEHNRGDFANDLAAAILNKGNALRALDRHDEAGIEYDKAIEIRRELVERKGRSELAWDLATTLMNKGRILLEKGHTQQADELFVRVDPSLFRGTELGNYHWTIGDRCFERGEYEQGLEHYLRARTALRVARRTAGINENWLEYQEKQQGAYCHFINRFLERGRIIDALETIQEAKGSVLADLRAELNIDGADEPSVVPVARRRLLDWLRQPASGSTEGNCSFECNQKTEEYFKVWRLAQKPRKTCEQLVDQPSRLGEIQEHLQFGWAILDFWRTANEEVTVFVLTRTEIHVERLRFPVADQRFSEHLNDLLACLADPFGYPHDDALYALYLRLFAPLRALLRRLDIHGLYLVPHGYLHALPLHACCWKEKGQRKYLCDEFEIAYLPSAAILTQLKPPQRGGRLFSLSNPLPNSDRTLPFSEYEGIQLRDRYPNNGNFYLGDEGTFASTVHWSGKSLVHFSCHGYGDSRFAPLSFLELHDDWLLAHDVVYRRPKLQEGALVLLNGCETSVRDWRAVDEGFGLMSAFLLRGAGLVLATQWSVVDACANQMLLTFVDRYLAGDGPVAALRQAQRRLRDLESDDILSHCEEVLKYFPEASRPYEVVNICALAVRVCKRNNRISDARDWFNKMATVCQQMRTPVGEELYLQMRKGQGTTNAQWNGPKNFDHPIFWGAFQLVGRVV